MVAVVAVGHQDVIAVLVMPVLVAFFIPAAERWLKQQRHKPRWGLPGLSLPRLTSQPSPHRHRLRPRVLAPDIGALGAEGGYLLIATGCLLALGVVMIWSASRGSMPSSHTESLLLRSGIASGIGLIALYMLSRDGVALLRRFTPMLLIGSFALLVLVLVPGLGGESEGAHRWLGLAGVRIEPAKLMMLALVGYAAGVLASNPRQHQTFPEVNNPLFVVTGAAALLTAAEPNAGAAVVLCLSIAAMLVALGTPFRFVGYLALTIVLELALVVWLSPVSRAYLAVYLDPWTHLPTTGLQAIQGQLAFSAGGLFGTGLGEPTHALLGLPGTNTTFMLAAVAEHLGLVGVLGVFVLFGLIAWSGLRIARAATDPYAKLLASGLVSLILASALTNAFVVLGIAPVINVPLPLVSYGPTDVLVTLMAIGLILNISRRRRPRLVAGSERPGGQLRRPLKPRDTSARRRGSAD